MDLSDYIAISSVLIAVAAFIYTFLTNTSKYEFTSQYRSEILTWYSETVEVLIRLKLEANDGFTDAPLKRDLLSKLSAKIEVGRIYFPNILDNNSYGRDRSYGYQGHRNLVMDFLVYSYRIFVQDKKSYSIPHVEALQRHFTSIIIETLDPWSFLKATRKHTGIGFSPELSFEDFYNGDPERLKLYIPK